MKEPSPKEAAIERENALNSTLFFARNVLGYDYTKDQDTGKITRDKYSGISDYGEHKKMIRFIDDPRSRRKMMQAPRGSFKTTMAAAWAIRQVIRNPNLRVLWASETYTQALQAISGIKAEFEKSVDQDENGEQVPSKIRQMFGDLKMAGDWKQSRFTIKGRTLAQREGTFQAGGIDKALTGGHYDIIILDDVVSFKNITNPEAIQKTLTFFNMVEPLLDPGGVLLVIGTRYAEEDLYAHIEEVGLYESLIIGCGFDVELDENKQPTLVGSRPTFRHLPKKFLQNKLRVMGLRNFMSQYVNKVSSGASQYFRRDQFKTARWEAWMEDLNAYILTDTATSAKEDGCYSVIALVGLDQGNCAYLCDMEVGHFTPHEFVSRLFEMRERWNQRIQISKVMMEVNAANQVFESMIEEKGRTTGHRLEIVRMKRGVGEPSKHQRIQRLTGRFENGQFVVLSTVPRSFMDLGQLKTLFQIDGFKDPDSGVVLPDGELVKQFIRFPSSVHRDIPDALADIDAVDNVGSRICMGTGIRERRARQEAMRRRGKVVPMHTTVNGRETWVDVARPDVGPEGFDRFDYFGENLPEVG